MTNRAVSAKLNWPRWAQVLLIALLVLIIGSRMTMLVDTAAARAGIAGELTWPGASFGLNPQAKPGFLGVARVDPGSPMARAGVMAGDTLRFERRYEYFRRQNGGERLNFTLDRQGVQSEHYLIAEPQPKTGPFRPQNAKGLLGALAVIVSMLIGCSILWRGWGNKTAMMLGAALVSMGVVGIALPPWAGEPWLAVPMMALISVCNSGVHLLLPFAMRLYEEHVRPLPRWHWQVAYAWLALMACFILAFTSDFIAVSGYLSWMGGLAIGRLLVEGISSVAGIAYLVAAWHSSAGAPRNRLALIVLALLAYALGIMVTGWTLAQTGQFFAAGWLGYVNALMMGLIAPGLLAYAVLRHKLFDLGFAVNRTLVFATVSTILLVAFGTLEWAVEHLVPEAWHEGSAFFSAGIAVGLFLLFHRIRDAVEHVIERLFFRSWHQNEAALKRFVAAAAHVEKPEALAGNFNAELARFTGGAAAELYLRTGEGIYASTAGAAIDPDDPALAAMRAEQGAVVPAEVHSPLPAALALPMMHQAALAGFVLLGPKPTGEDYRPDEVEILGWATQQVGLDLQAIRVRELELTNIKQAAQIQSLTGIVEAAALAGAGGRAQ